MMRVVSVEVVEAWVSMTSNEVFRVACYKCVTHLPTSMTLEINSHSALRILLAEGSSSPGYHQ